MHNKPPYGLKQPVKSHFCPLARPQRYTLPKTCVLAWKSGLRPIHGYELTNPGAAPAT